MIASEDDLDDVERVLALCRGEGFTPEAVDALELAVARAHCLVRVLGAVRRRSDRRARQFLVAIAARQRLERELRVAQARAAGCTCPVDPSGEIPPGHMVSCLVPAAVRTLLSACGARRVTR